MYKSSCIHCVCLHLDLYVVFGPNHNLNPWQLFKIALCFRKPHENYMKIN